MGQLLADRKQPQLQAEAKFSSGCRKTSSWKAAITTMIGSRSRRLPSIAPPNPAAAERR
jgi:hypothetical protein